MTAKIEVNNAVSVLSGISKEDLRVVRRHVAYRAQRLPHPSAQLIIKAYFRQNYRMGGSTDLARLWADSDIRGQLADAGCDSSNLTVQMLESTLRQRGTWDGWVRVVELNGSFPTGLLGHVHRALTLRLGIEPTIDDKRADEAAGTPIEAPSLFTFQQEAVDSFLAAGRGVIDLPPRSGKTRIALATICKLNVPTIYVVPTVGIAKQTLKVVDGWLKSRGKTTIALTGGLSSMSAKKHRQILTADVIISTPQTAVKIPNLHSRKLLIIDEFHHSAAKTWQAVGQAAVGAYWRMGLTGTHFRADGKDLEMAGVLGRAVYRQTVAGMVEVGRLVPAKIAMLRIHGPAVNTTGYDMYKDGIVVHNARNEALVYAAKLLLHTGRRVLVLTKEVEHAKALAAAIPNAVAVDGKDNDNVDVQLQAMASGTVRCVVGTSVIGEGRDVPVADALVYAAGGKSKVKVTQDYFRVLTACEGKTTGIVVDTADTHSGKLAEHSAARLQLYRSEPSFASEVIEVEDLSGWLSRI